MSKSLEKLADKMIRLSPEEQQKLQLIIKAKLLPKMAKAPKWGVNTYVESTKPKIGRHKKRMNKHEKRSYKKYRGQGK